MSQASAWPARWTSALEQVFEPEWLARGAALLEGGAKATLGAPEAEALGLTWTLSEARSAPIDLRVALWPPPRAALDRALNRSGRGPGARADVADRGAEDLELLAEALSTQGHPLLPTRAEDLAVECACGRENCAHGAAALLALTPLLAGQADLLLALRGIQLARSVEARSAAPGPGARDATCEPGDRSDHRARAAGARAQGSASCSPPLEDMLDDFWSAGRGLDRFETRPRRAEIPLLVLRHLGPPPFTDADLGEALAGAYARIARWALELAYAPAEEGGVEY